MNRQSIMQQALGKQWSHLPHALQAHYQYDDNMDTGHLDIHYPIYLQPLFSFLHRIGALINRRGNHIPTTVEKHFSGHRQHWNRTMVFPDDNSIHFRSTWVYEKNNQLIEYVNPVIGLRMAVSIHDNRLYYEGMSFVIKLGKRLISIPEWLLLGHTTIVEEALDDRTFKMDFRLTHPLFGQVFQYTGHFKTYSTE